MKEIQEWIDTNSREAMGKVRHYLAQVASTDPALLLEDEVADLAASVEKLNEACQKFDYFNRMRSDPRVKALMPTLAEREFLLEQVKRGNPSEPVPFIKDHTRYE